MFYQRSRFLIIAALLLCAVRAEAQQFLGPEQYASSPGGFSNAYTQTTIASAGATTTLYCPDVGKINSDYDLTETVASPTFKLNTAGCRAGQWIRLMPLRICNGTNCPSGPGQPTFTTNTGSFVWEATLGTQPSFDTAASKTDEIAFMWGSDSRWHEYGFLLDPTTGTTLGNSYQQYSMLYGGGPGVPVGQTPSACNTNGSVVIGGTTGPNCGQIQAGAGVTITSGANTLSVASSGIYTHTLSGATPVAAVQFATAPNIDRENLLLSINVTSATLPGSAGAADSEIIHWLIRQPTSGAAFTLPTATVGPFTAGAGTTVHAAAGVTCPTIGTTTSATAPSELLADFIYNANITEWIVTYCNTIN